MRRMKSIAYSKLVNDEKRLMKQNFIIPQNDSIEFPAVIDEGSRTIGGQLMGVKICHSIVIRIASNYSLRAKRLYVSLEKKGVARSENWTGVHIPLDLQKTIATT